MASSSPPQRGFWASRLGFILAAAGSAVGLGNVWKFPFVTGDNGGGVFVVLYLACVVLVGLPIMNAEVLLGRATQRSPVAAFRLLTQGRSGWVFTGWLGVAAGFAILSYYSVVAGWTLYYAVLAVKGAFTDVPAGQVQAIFSELVGNPGLNVALHGGFMGITMAVVLGGVQAGIERWSRLLMPALLMMLVGLALYAASLSGFPQAIDFIFGMHADRLGPAGMLEAMGQAFFSLSLGMGAMLTYGSYLPRDTSIFRCTAWVALLDTGVALLASVVVFPVTFTHNIPPAAGPGLVFKSIPVAFSQMPGGHVLAILFFVLLVFAALTSSISLMEVVASSFIDLYGWGRRRATLLMGSAIFVLGLPSALSGGSLFGGRFKAWLGQSFFDLVDNIASNWMLPLGGLLIALFSGWAMDAARRREEFIVNTPPRAYGTWIKALRYVAPVAVLLVLLKSTGVLALVGLK